MGWFGFISFARHCPHPIYSHLILIYLYISICPYMPVCLYVDYIFTSPSNSIISKCVYVLCVSVSAWLFECMYLCSCLDQSINQSITQSVSQSVCLSVCVMHGLHAWMHAWEMAMANLSYPALVSMTNKYAWFWNKKGSQAWNKVRPPFKIARLVHITWWIKLKGQI